MDVVHQAREVSFVLDNKALETSLEEMTTFLAEAVKSYSKRALQSMHADG